MEGEVEVRVGGVGREVRGGGGMRLCGVCV